jgi:hypothetical protein
MLDAVLLERALQALGAVLEQRRQPFEIVTIGGSSLMLLGLISRPTRDLDIVALVEDTHYVRAAPLSPALDEAIRDVADTLDLPPNWLNPGPTDLLQLGLPVGFEDRVETRYYRGLVVHLASRYDQVHFKLYAAADQGVRSKHADDLRRLEPTRDELLTAARWTRTHDPSEAFHDLLVAVLRDFGVDDTDAVL